jgi:pyridoxamine 5'-phosphate oxidase
MNVGDMREDYRKGELEREDMAADPFRQFDVWFKEALATPSIEEANAMTLATADASGRVTARTVLLKAWDEKGFVFFTNFGSTKAQQIAENNQVALLFPWLPLQRQVSISGRAEKISLAESFAYFASRPFSSRIGAWVSQQSSIITSRKLLEMKFEELRRKFSEGEVPLPDFWGGFRVRPETVEYWQGRTSRLHDRFLYTRTDGDEWTMDRLAP